MLLRQLKLGLHKSNLCFVEIIINVTFKRQFSISKGVKVKQSKCEMVRILNVAEKNDAAKSIAEIMSNGRCNRRNGLSVYNKIYEYDYHLFNQNCSMIMTSVSGHLLNLEFVGTYRKWQGCNPVSLFDAPVEMICLENYQPIKATLEREIKKCQHLILWTDGDREGENIGFEIIDVCKAVKPNIQVHRARFSEITHQAVARACSNLCPPDQRLSDAVNVRRELDLRIGASFTRFQTLRLQRVFPDVLSNQLISYGSCQFPTLGFVVDRYKQVQAFISEPFWKLKVTHKKEDTTTEFSWKRGRLFDHTACLVLYQICLEDPTAKVVDIRSRNRSKWRPQPLDTVELEKTASRKLHINAKEALNVAEKLYTKGFISYPRTETTIFPKELDLVSLVQMQCEDNNWGGFANRVLENGPNPRQGSKTDNAHPPIHPIKYTNSLQGNEKTIYEYVVRHFLACLSKDAEGQETTVEIAINDEMFAVNGLMIIAKNYLEVFPYEKWNAKVIAEYTLGEVFQPSSIEMNESETNAPDLLTEADLIALMEKHGIGTDATHAEHIETIKSRLYVGVNENGRFIPGELGMGLVEGYDLMGFHMSKPHLRAELEADLKRISEGSKNPQVVLREQVLKYKEYFIEAVRQASKIDTALSSYFNTVPGEVTEDNFDSQIISVMKCPKCSSGDIVVKTKRDNKGFYLSCLAYPQCNAKIWLPDSLEQISVTLDVCSCCRPGPVKMLKFKFKRGALRPFYEDELVKCLGGCEPHFLEVIGARPITSASQNSTSTSSFQSLGNATARNRSSDSGYSSGHYNQFSSNRNVTRSNSLNQPNSSGNTRQTNNTGFVQQSSFSSSQPVTGPPRPVSVIHPTDGFNASRNDIVCMCGMPAVLLTVRKEGPNKGRQFYKCSIQSDNRCDFFLWEDNGNTSGNKENGNNSTDTRSYRNNSASTTDYSIPMCQCPAPTPAKLLTVSKAGPNTGRKFYTCPKPRGEGCNFFQWESDDVSSTSSAVPSLNGFYSFGPSQAQGRKRPNSSDSGRSSKRRCGVCGETGHNKRNCPHNR